VSADRPPEAPARFWSALRIADVHADLLRNIVAPQVSEDLFDDLSDDPAHTRLALQVEQQVQPAAYQSEVPLIDRPFEQAQWSAAIGWPFRHWQASRYSDGSFGVWYGADTLETSVRESAYHWIHGFLADAGFDHLPVEGERQVYAVACRAALLDLRPAVGAAPRLLHPSDYALPRAVGSRLRREGHPGLLAPSVRHPKGETYAVFNPAVLSHPRPHTRLTYRLEGGRIAVEKKPGRRWMSIDLAGL
jgi:hypothetical protein